MMTIRFATRGLFAAFAIVLLFSAGSACAEDAAPTIRFDRDIRPILSDTCFKCHGPDSAKREAELRLDLHDRAIAETDSGVIPIKPGDLEGSEVWRRITSDDPDVRMPPAETGKVLTKAQIALIKQWIEQGAEWREHWSFIAPVPHAPPQVTNESWLKNDIDRFVLHKLEAEGLSPSSEADKRRLIRRVTLDLTGLPPTIQEVDEFLADDSPDAYEKIVDRLLASPRYGERIALMWLDAARYADTHGYIFDTQREMWRYRDWVIDAYNANMPFDQFTTEQLAGDLLPKATPTQKIASGFNRNHVINGEFGASPAEYLVENIADRVNTTSTIWMGLTTACARCHDHKFDPVTQKEFFEMYAFFGNIAEQGLDGLFANAAPVMSAPTSEQDEKMEAATARLKKAEAAINALNPSIAKSQAAWEATFAEPYAEKRDGLIAYWPFDKHFKDESGQGFHVDTNDPKAPFGGGVFKEAAFFFGLNMLYVPKAGDLSADKPFTLAAWINPGAVHGQRGIFTKMAEGLEFGRGYALQIHGGKLVVALVHEYPNNCIQVETDEVVKPGEYRHVAVTYDGSGKASGVRVYLDGQRQFVRTVTDDLNGPINNSEPLSIAEGPPNASFRGQIDEARIYERALAASELSELPGVSIHSLLATPPKERSGEQARRIREYYLEHVALSEWRAANREHVAASLAKREIETRIPSSMVMQELPAGKMRETYILKGGAFDQPGDKVTAGTPRFLPPMTEAMPRDRLGLAQWLLDPAHPLTARVTVNRFWQLYFGHGIVQTPEDFGSQGAPPSHPELLDWLALKFIDSGWDVKAMQRLIVTSATYRQSSKIPRDMLERDPDNHLLARGPRFRLAGEFVRDSALAVSGLLVEKLGGPSVKPYQPAILWTETAFDPSGNKWTAQIFEQDHGEKLYRRSMYTFWKRSAPPPSLLVFDAPERDRCTVKRAVSNSPLQALVTMNDPTFVEASRKLAERMMNEGGSQDRDRIAYAFRLATSRLPSEHETSTLANLLGKQLARFENDSDAAEQLLSVGESPRDEKLSASELAAYTTVASVILNLDETLTKN